MATPTRQSEQTEATLDRIRRTPAWRQAESEEEAERIKRRKALVKERVAILRERAKEQPRLHEAYLAALSKVEEAAAALAAAKAEAAAAQGASFRAGHSYDRQQLALECELLESAGPGVQELRDWAREAWWKVRPGSRAVKTERGLVVGVPRSEAFTAARSFLHSLVDTERGPLFDLCMEAVDAETMASRLAALREEAEAAIAEAQRDEGLPSIAAAVKSVAKRVLSAADARAAASEPAAAGEAQ